LTTGCGFAGDSRHMHISPSVTVRVQDEFGNTVMGSNAVITIGSIPTGVSAMVNAQNGIATFSSLVLNANGSYVLAASSNGLTSATSNAFTIGAGTNAAKTKVGVFRNGNSYLLDSNGNQQYDAGIDAFITTFNQGLPKGGALAGDIGIAGDWTGDTKYKIGVYRPSTGEWFLDINNDGLFDAGDVTYHFGGLAGDLPVVGDWAGMGKSCIGIFRGGGFWLLDLNCNGTFDNTPTDAFFPFGGLAGDVPVVGAWTGTNTRVGVVRAYAPGGVQQSPPFFWVLDAGTASAGNTPTDHPVAAAPVGLFPLGGVPCTTTSVPGCSVANPLLTSDIYVAGDWLGTGVYHAGIYRSGSWLLDLTGAHTYDTFFQFGGLATDTPVVGKW
jgi:hypothetical protein